MKMLTRLQVATAACALATAGLVAPAASAAADTTAPSLTLPVRATFVQGSTISATGTDRYEPYGPTETTVSMKVGWSASDPSGVCGYSMSYTFGDYSMSAWSPWSNTTVMTLDASDYDDQEGGGGDKTWYLNVRVRDCAGNITMKSTLLAPVVYQQDGQSYRYGSLATSRTGDWSTTTCACWSATTALKTTARGARLNFQLPLTDESGSGVETVPVALVMEKAPGRGKANILVDGTQVATVDTYSSTKQHRSVVWVGRMPLGNHTVSVVNQATVGRARIDVDALAVSTGYNEVL